LWTLVLTVVVVAVVACKQDLPPSGPHTSSEPLLLLEEDETAEDTAPPTGPVADNSRCYVCHINYEDEELAVVHARANISCEQCHGPSDAHCGDEDNITPPDIMYPAAKINPFCMGCHPKEKIDIPAHKLILASANTGRKYCINCHGKHRLGYRTRKWDKATGKLITDK